MLDITYGSPVFDSDLDCLLLFLLYESQSEQWTILFTIVFLLGALPQTVKNE